MMKKTLRVAMKNFQSHVASETNGARLSPLSGNQPVRDAQWRTHALVHSTHVHTGTRTTSQHAEARV